MKNGLRMWTNGWDYAIAFTVEEAQRLTFRHNTGRDAPESFSQVERDDLEGDGWQGCVLDRTFTLHEDDGTSTTKTVQEWVKAVGSSMWFASCGE
jgi:hypothetical protein